MAKWYVQRGEKEFGPFEDKQLKQLAESGKLKPIDVVRRDDRQTVGQRQKSRGYFPTPMSQTCLICQTLTKQQWCQSQRKRCHRLLLFSK